MIGFKQWLQEEEPEDYRGQHQAPDEESGAPLHDVTANDIYPKTFYDEPSRYWTTSDHEQTAWGKVHRLKGKPRNLIAIYRAIPREKKTYTPLSGKHIHPGDWVAIHKGYAHEHGRANLNNKYGIASKLCRAEDVYTSGDSLAEWGYSPKKKG